MSEARARFGGEGRPGCNDIEFLRTASGLALVERRGYVVDGSRKESVADHTWMVSLMVIALRGRIDPSDSLDWERILTMVVLHDLPEVLAGDAFAHDAVARSRAKQIEFEAALDIFTLLESHGGPALLVTWLEFEAGITPEARVARALDRLQALAMNVFTRGRLWKESGITEAQSRQLNAEAMAFSPEMGELFEEFYRQAGEQGLWPVVSPA